MDKINSPFLYVEIDVLPAKGPNNQLCDNWLWWTVYIWISFSDNVMKSIFFKNVVYGLTVVGLDLFSFPTMIAILWFLKYLTTKYMMHSIEYDILKLAFPSLSWSQRKGGY